MSYQHLTGQQLDKPTARDWIMDLAARISAGIAPDWCDEMRQHMDALAAEATTEAVAERDRARSTAVRLEQETARLEAELAHASRPSYSHRHVWSVWREDQPIHAFYATLNDARQGSIDCWEEDEPACPDYSWRPDGGRLELVVGGEAGGVYISRHDVFGTLGPALPWAADMPDDDLNGFLNDLVSAAIDRWRSDPDIPDREILANIEKVCANWRTPGQGHRSDDEAGEHA